MTGKHHHTSFTSTVGEWLEMNLQILVFVILFQESQQNVCTDLKNFKPLNNTYKPVGRAVHSSVALGLLHCVKKCREWEECKVFEFNINDKKCTLYDRYQSSSADRSEIDTNMVYSAMKDWSESILGDNKKNRTMIPGYDCFLMNDKPLLDFYKGRLNVTRSGFTCQRWDSGEVHNHDGFNDRDEHFSNTGENLTTVGNYCRIPLKTQPRAPWCYTTNADKRWEVCDVTAC